jgi:hypothetical protein
MGVVASHPASHTLWHRRLGHPSSRVVSKLLSDNGISVASCSIDNSVCDACQRGKNCRLPLGYCLWHVQSIVIGNYDNIQECDERCDLLCCCVDLLI